jgi:hypothetical protein
MSLFDSIPLILLLTHKAISRDEVAAIEHGLHVGLVVLGIIVPSSLHTASAILDVDLVGVIAKHTLWSILDHPPTMDHVVALLPSCLEEFQGTGHLHICNFIDFINMQSHVHCQIEKNGCTLTISAMPRVLTGRETMC